MRSLQQIKKENENTIFHYALVQFVQFLFLFCIVDAIDGSI